MAEQRWFDRIPDGVFFAGACLSFLAVALAIATLTWSFSDRIWSLGDTDLFLRMADLIARGGTPYVDFADPKPPLLFFLLAVPQALGHGMAGGLLLAALANVVSAAALTKIAWRLYGRGAGLLAGTLFVVGATWAECYFVLTEPFSVAFVLLSVYFMTCGGRHRYLTAGVCAGLAIGFKQYALLLLPLSLIYALRKGEMRQAFLPYAAGVLLPLAAMFAAVFLIYGADAGFASLYWSFGLAPDYFSEGSIGGVTTYKIGDPVIAAFWVALALSLFASLLLLAVAGALAWKPRPEEELFILAAVAFAATLIIRPFLHYWAFALPFAVLLAAGAFGKARERLRLPSPRGKGAFALLLGAVYAAIVCASAGVTYVLTAGVWRPRAVEEFYGLGDIVLKATARYFGHVPEPAAIVLAMGLSDSLIAVTAISLLTALTVAAVAWRLYGRGPALLAGALFVAGAVFALGYALPSDCVAVLLMALSLYLLVSDAKGGLLLSGLLMGAAIVIKPFAIVLAPLALFMLLRSGKRVEAAGFALCVLVPVVLFGAAALSSGAWGVSAGPAVPVTSSSAVYRVPDALLAMLNLAAAGAFVTITVIATIAAFLWKRAGPVEEYLLLAVLIVPFTLLFGAFVHYWFVALPFAAVLCARPFSDNRKVIMQNGP